jgi:hypothetical protein
MSTNRMDVRLTASDRMNEGKPSSENNIIRIPRRARKQFETRTDKITITYGKKTVALEIKAAFKEDIVELKQSIEDGDLTVEQSRYTGFVTTATLQSLMGLSEEAQTDFCYMSDDIEDITLGSDPEFVLVDPSTLSYKYAEQIAGFPRSGYLGADGPLAEVRPPPSRTVSGAVENIRKILAKGHKSIRQYNWYAGATYRNPLNPKERTLHIGGHIHLGDPMVLPSRDKQGIYRQVIRMLDELMAIPLVRIDGPKAHLRRNTVHTNGFGKYGTWGDTRPQVGRFEWRVPSGLWMAHPDFAAAVLGTAKAITETCYQMMAEHRFDPNWVCARVDTKGFLQEWSAMGSSQAAAIVNKADPKLVTAALLKRTENKLKGMDNYTKYKDNIDEFVRLVKLSAKDRSNINLDIKDTWLNGGKLIKERA